MSINIDKEVRELRAAARKDYWERVRRLDDAEAAYAAMSVELNYSTKWAAMQSREDKSESVIRVIIGAFCLGLFAGTVVSLATVFAVDRIYGGFSFSSGPKREDIITPSAYICNEIALVEQKDDFIRFVISANGAPVTLNNFFNESLRISCERLVILGYSTQPSLASDLFASFYYENSNSAHGNYGKSSDCSSEGNPSPMPIFRKGFDILNRRKQDKTRNNNNKHARPKSVFFHHPQSFFCNFFFERHADLQRLKSSNLIGNINSQAGGAK